MNREIFLRLSVTPGPSGRYLEGRYRPKGDSFFGSFKPCGNPGIMIYFSMSVLVFLIRTGSGQGQEINPDREGGRKP